MHGTLSVLTCKPVRAYLIHLSPMKGSRSALIPLRLHVASGTPLAAVYGHRTGDSQSVLVDCAFERRCTKPVARAAASAVVVNTVCRV
jgi:hypothetical protein